MSPPMSPALTRSRSGAFEMHHPPDHLQVPRMLRNPAPAGLREHRVAFGALEAASGRDLFSEVEAAGLRGRGGAGFPTAIKLNAVRSASAPSRQNRSRTREPVIVANGAEGEPASAKDKVLIRAAPHLVLDGITLAALALGSTKGFLCIDRRDSEAYRCAERAVQERGANYGVSIRVMAAPARYVAGEETALVRWINGGEAKPTYARPRPFERGVGGAPTLVDNVETMANIALIALNGADAWRDVGTAEEPGSMLVTMLGAMRYPGVYEVAIGTPLPDLLRMSGTESAEGVLVGGYFGTWLTAGEASRASLSRSGLSPFNASPGCGLVAVLPRGHCPLLEVSNVLGWLTANSAGQCGACVNGLPALAGTFRTVATGASDSGSEERLDRWAAMVERRGACKMPDGAVHFLRSARTVFADHIADHRRYGPCAPNTQQFLPTPELGGWR